MNAFTALLIMSIVAIASAAFAAAWGNAFDNRPARPPRSHHEDRWSRPPSSWLD